LKLLLHPVYCPDITTFAALAQNQVIWEVEDNYQKQTFRNRCYICTDQGKQMLTIPIRHVGGRNGRQRYKEVRLENSYRWQRQHWRTLQTAYRTSPFFEFYEDDLAPLYERRFEFLLDFNLKVTSSLCDCLRTEMPRGQTAAYDPAPAGLYDARYLVDAKRERLPFPMQYHQVFGDRHGFVPHLSILDLLFNLGTTSLMELQKYPLTLANG